MAVLTNKKINDYWIDENNNSWDASDYTEEQAQEKSESLVNCSDRKKKIKKEKEINA